MIAADLTERGHLQEQYVFIHDAIMEVIMCGDTQIDAGDFSQSLKKLKSTPKFRPNEFDNQFMVSSQCFFADCIDEGVYLTSATLIARLSINSLLLWCIIGPQGLLYRL